MIIITLIWGEISILKYLKVNIQCCIILKYFQLLIFIPYSRQRLFMYNQLLVYPENFHYELHSTVSLRYYEHGHNVVWLLHCNNYS